MAPKHGKLKKAGVMEPTRLLLSADNIVETIKHAEEQSTFEGWIAEPETVARRILQDVGADPDVPSTYPDPPPDQPEKHNTPEHYAGRIMRHIGITRLEIRSGNAERAAYWGIQLGVLVHEADMRFEWELVAERGLKFIEGPRGHRADALARAIISALGALDKPSVKASTNELLKYIANDPAIESVGWADKVVRWIRRDGTIDETSFKSFRNRVSLRRKKISI